jgi:hypothetical protein
LVFRHSANRPGWARSARVSTMSSVWTTTRPIFDGRRLAS